VIANSAKHFERKYIYFSYILLTFVTHLQIVNSSRKGKTQDATNTKKT